MGKRRQGWDTSNSEYLPFPTCFWNTSYCPWRRISPEVWKKLRQNFLRKALLGDKVTRDTIILQTLWSCIPVDRQNWYSPIARRDKNIKRTLYMCFSPFLLPIHSIMYLYRRQCANPRHGHAPDPNSRQGWWRCAHIRSLPAMQSPRGGVDHYITN